MKNRKVFTLLLTGMLTLSMGSTVYASGTDAAIAEAQAEKQAAQEGLAQVQNSIGSLESKKQELESYLADLNAQYEDLTNSISELSIQAAEKEDELNKVKTELEKAKKASADQYESMKLRIAYMYENAGSAVSQEVIDETRKEYGLDQPFLVQYAKWFAGMATGDMGKSYVSRRDVYETFIEKLPATIMLTISSVLLTMLIAIPLGILSAVQHNKWSDYLIRFLSFIGNSMPNFFAALVLMYFLSIKLGWFPVITTENKLQSLVLPTLTLAISMASKYTRQVRATILEELNKDYVAGAKARGVRGSVIIWKNVMKSSMLTIITLLALSIGSLLGGTTIVETIFMWDGVGKMAVDAITMRDYPIIQAYVAWMAIIYVVVNLITDIIYHYLDPRVRLGGDQA